MTYQPSFDLIPKIERGQVQAIGRMISRAESGVAEARDALAEIYRRTGTAHVIGITGVPGSGKSTLVAELARRLRAADRKVGIVAIDPSSPYSGGAILGDRIRMSELGTDPGVYIRSMATRGSTGGMAKATLEACDVLDLAGFDTILIETVGVGQDEVEIARASNTTVVVTAPGLGDEIQAIKAGTLEIADIHLVSKCDRSDAHRALTDIRQMLMLGMARTASKDWQIPVVGVSSYSGEGFDKLLEMLEKHRKVAFDTDSGKVRREEIAEFRLTKTAETLLAARFTKGAKDYMPPLIGRLRSREEDPYGLAQSLLSSVFA